MTVWKVENGFTGQEEQFYQKNGTTLKLVSLNFCVESFAIKPNLPASSKDYLNSLQSPNWKNSW